MALLKFLQRPSPLWFSILGWVLAAGFGLAWMHRLVPYSTVFGDLASWVVAIGTTGAVVYAARQVHLATASREEELAARARKEVQEIKANARKVAISFKFRSSDLTDTVTGTKEPFSWKVRYRALNASPFPVNNVTIRCPLSGDSGFEGYQSFEVGTLLPGKGFTVETREVLLTEWKPHIDELISLGSVLFTDVHGHNWEHSHGGLTSREHPPRIS